jgi:predicted nucleotidyltransferase
MLTKEEILQKIEESKAKIKEYGIKKIGVFGSFVRVEQNESSDVDILVEFEKGKITFDNYMGLKFFLEDSLNCEVDLVIVDDIKPRLKPYILGEVVYAERL